MVASGVTRARLPADNEVLCLLDDPRVPDLATAWGTTRSAAAVSLWADRLAGAVVAIGNAPTALFHLLEMLDAGAPRPAAIIGVPVGFIGAAESKEALVSAPRRHPLPGRTRPPRRLGDGRVRGQRSRAGGGMSSTPGRLYGVGLGPGDPELITRKAARLIAEADVIAYHAGTARPLYRPLDRRRSDPGGSDRGEARLPGDDRNHRPSGRLRRARWTEFYDASAARLAAHLSRGRDVVVLCRGRPAVLRLVHVPARPAGLPVSHRDRPRCDVDIARLLLRRRARSCARPTC